MPFASTALVRRVEQAEARSLGAIIAACAGDTFLSWIGGGLAIYRGPGSPLNKVIGLGFEALSEHSLAELEQRYLERDAPVQIELSTHADSALVNLLVQRGYRFSGFENVLGRGLDGDLIRVSTGLEVRRAQASEFDAWVEVLTDGFSEPTNEQRVAHDMFDRDALARVFRDMAQKPTLERWLALRDGSVAGAASISVQDGIAQLFGAATHPAHRRRGVQASLLSARLESGRAQGAELAVITTQPGSQSQLNAQRAGFMVLYARAVWMRG